MPVVFHGDGKVKDPRDAGMKAAICDGVSDARTWVVSSLSQNPPGAVDAWAIVKKEENMNSEQSRAALDILISEGRVNFIDTSCMQG